MSHYPLYMSQEPAGQLQFEKSAGEAWLNAERCEYEGHARTCTGGEHWQRETERQRSGSASSVGSARAELEPILHEGGVDVYWAGHIHYYQTFDGPLWGGQLLSRGLDNPDGIIHVCSGNGGPPSKSVCGKYNASTGKNSKLCIDTPYSYTRLTVHNATDLLWQQISNEDSSVIDEWTLHQEHHERRKLPSPDVFPPPPPLPSSLRWIAQPDGTLSESDLPPNAIQSGRNLGGGTYICRVPGLLMGEANITGSLSFAKDDEAGPVGGHCRVSTSQLWLSVSSDFEVLIDQQPSSATSYGWAAVTTTNTHFDLPGRPVQTGANDEGPTYICRYCTQPMSLCGNDTNMSGSLSYFYEMKGNPHSGFCRLGTEYSPSLHGMHPPWAPGVAAPFDVLVSPSLPPAPAPPPAPPGLKWVAVAKTTTPADLPAHAVKSGNNTGGGTYVCRITGEEGGEADLTGSLSYSGGPGHCRAATDSAPFVKSTNLEILTADSSAWRWADVHATHSPTDLPARAVQAGHADGEPTFVCRVPQKEGTPGHVYESGLSGSVSYRRHSTGECRVVTSGAAHYVSADFQVMVATARRPGIAHWKSDDGYRAMAMARRAMLRATLSPAPRCARDGGGGRQCNATSGVAVASCPAATPDCRPLLQAALDSCCSRVVVKSRPGGEPWVLQGNVDFRSHQTVAFDKGVELQAAKGFFKSKGAPLTTAFNVTSLTLVGNGAKWTMRKMDYAQPSLGYVHSEARPGLWMFNTSDVHISGLMVSSSGGDGIEVVDSRRLHVRDCVLDDSKCSSSPCVCFLAAHRRSCSTDYRQGMASAAALFVGRAKV